MASLNSWPLMVYFDEDVLEVMVTANDTIHDLRSKLSTMIGVPASRIAISFNDQVLTNATSTLHANNIRSEGDLVIATVIHGSVPSASTGTPAASTAPLLPPNLFGNQPTNLFGAQPLLPPNLLPPQQGGGIQMASSSSLLPPNLR
jgi:hypothetical protein